MDNNTPDASELKRTFALLSFLMTEDQIVEQMVLDKEIPHAAFVQALRKDPGYEARFHLLRETLRPYIETGIQEQLPPHASPLLQNYPKVRAAMITLGTISALDDMAEVSAVLEGPRNREQLLRDVTERLIAHDGAPFRQVGGSRQGQAGQTAVAAGAASVTRRRPGRALLCLFQLSSPPWTGARPACAGPGSRRLRRPEPRAAGFGQR
ncbi:hypothetical protein [Arvimicrobium flavum]|uniref:hypothetical protein n=1 Tax=Arvimicrobium flavum TaxID=3393320 RepID=UPI00237A5381|nr:hypothetical protein [Mesorhizobium shangrilense]